MKRRSFLKGLGLLIISPFVPKIPIIKNTPIKKIKIDHLLTEVSFKWSSIKSDPMADLIFVKEKFLKGN